MIGSARTGRRRDPARRRVALGVAAILVVAAIGYVAYTANSGLPLQSTYGVFVDVPNADRLINTADVRIGGVRVGEVLGVSAARRSNAQTPYARISVALDPAVGRLPVDTSAQVRPASVLGLTYLDLVLGRSRQTVAPGGTLQLAQAQPSSDLTDLFNVFNQSSARRFQDTLGSLAGGLAGRGGSINATIHAVDRLLPSLTSVATVLAAPQTRLSDFLHAYENTFSALGPVSGQLTGLISGAATTFDSLAGVRTPLSATISALPPAESASTRAFVAVRPALDGLAQLVVDLRPAGRVLPAALSQINSTLAAGVPPLREIPSFSDHLTSALANLNTLSLDTSTNGSLRKLTDLGSAARGALSVLVPAQVNCNVISLFTSGFAGVFGTLGTGNGPSLGALFLEDTGAVGEALQNARPSPNVGINPIPIENQQSCQAGNEPWTGKQQLGNPSGLQSTTTRPTVPPPGVAALAQKAGLLTPPAGLR
jgi:virulence factor Mce-like protein